jgi:prepilin-type processing-associated H-X9-DG protein
VHHPTNFNDYISGNSWLTMSESAIQHSSETIVFGEKENSSEHFYLDYEQYDDLKELNQNRHMAQGKDRAGGSNYIFADGSAGYLRFGKTLNPINMWGTTEQWRNAGVAMP